MQEINKNNNTNTNVIEQNFQKDTENVSEDKINTLENKTDIKDSN